MPTLNISSITSTSMSWYVSGLGSYWNSSNYQYIAIGTGITSEGSATAPTGTLDTVYPGSSGSSYSTPSQTYSSLSSGSPYTLYAYAKTKSGKWYSAGSRSFSTLKPTPPPKPSTPSWYEYGADSPYQVSLDWTTVSNATYYEVYNGTTYETKTFYNSYGSWGGLQPNTTYGFRVRAVNNNGSSDWNSYVWITTKSLPLPSTPSWYKYSAGSPTQINLDWTTVSGATYYEVYNGTTVATRKYYESYGYWDGLQPNTNYGFRVRSGNDYGVSDWSDYIWVTTEPLPLPDTPTWVSYAPSSATQITLDWSTISDATYYEVYNSITYETRKYYESHAYWDKILPNTKYGFRVRSGNNNGVSDWSGYVYATTPYERPAEWLWTSSVSSGVSFKITADEWNKFIARIEAYRQYKGLSSYGFTKAVKGGSFTASMYNEARNGIYNMNPSITIPPYKNSGDKILASNINNLATSLNSVK